MNMMSAILKKIVPDLIGAAISLVTAYWLLQAVSADPRLMNIIRIATTIFIVLYLAIILIGASLQVIDEHRIRDAYYIQIMSGSNPPQIVDASPSPRLIGSSFYSTSSYSPPHRSKNFLPIIRIVIIVVCVLGSIFGYFYFMHLTIPPSNNIHPTPSAVTTNPWSSWQTIPNKCRIVGRTYYVSTHDGQDLNACYSPKTRFKNFTYDVEMTILKGHCGGLLFRKFNNANKYYVFQVCQDKTYALLKYLDDAGRNFQAFFGVSKDNRAIIPGLGFMNTIAVTAKGSAFTLSINHVQVAVIDDTSYSEGAIALVASSDLYYGTTEVAYQNVKVSVN